MMFSCCGARDDKHDRFLKYNKNAASPAKKVSSEKVELKFDPTTFEGALVKVDFATISFLDVANLNKGTDIGTTFSGEIKKLGKVPADAKLKKGDKVYGFFTGAQGSVQEWVAVPLGQLAAIPDGISESTAAAIPFLASWGAHAQGAIKKDEKVYIHTKDAATKKLIQNVLAKQQATETQEIKDAAHYYHLGEAQLEGVLETIKGISWSGEGKAKGVAKHEINVPAQFAANYKWVSDNKDLFKGVSSTVVKDATTLENSIKDVLEGKAVISVYNVEGLADIEVVVAKPPTQTPPANTATTGTTGTTAQQTPSGSTQPATH
jgi:hypothetical protein